MVGRAKLDFSPSNHQLLVMLNIELETMQKDLGAYRKSYEKEALTEHTAPEDPMVLFQEWFRQTEEAKGVEEPNAMTLSTLGSDGFPKSRIVLLKAFSDEGFVFYTNYSSEKGMAIANEPKVCLSFFWPNLERQVIIKGTAEKVADTQSDSYFKSRPKGSQLGALVSDQSTVIPSREYLENELEALEKTHLDGPVERPDFWGGYVVKPVSMEFWQGRPNRLHDRLRFRTGALGKWQRERLAP